MRSAGVKGICANGLLCTVRADSPSCQSLGFSVKARYSTETIVEKKELKINSRLLHINTLRNVFIFDTSL